MSSIRKILIAEDDPASAEYLRIIMKELGYEVVAIAATGEKVIELCKKTRPDLVLMDIILEGKISGCEAALKIRHCGRDTKIIFLTAHAAPEMIEYAVEAEAYGYLMKPYRKEEIQATVKLAFSHGTPGKMPLDDVVIPLRNGFIYNIHSHRLIKKHREIPLCKKQLKLIEVLAKNRNCSVSHEQICLFVWGQERSACTLRSLIYRVRTIIGHDMIKNVNGIGYEIAAHSR